MRLKRLRRRAGGVEDHRGESPGLGGGGLGGLSGMGLPVGGGLGVVVVLIIIVALQYCGSGGLGIPTGGLDDLGGASSAASGQTGPDPDAKLVEFMDAVFDDVQITWEEDIFKPSGMEYKDTSLVLFTDRVMSGCGAASSAMGPFYCPADQKVYLDLGFFKVLEQQFGVAGDFAEAYVIAHEIGHHIQTLLGTNAAVQRKARAEPDLANELSVRLELQADCFAGVWGASVYARGAIDPGDIEEGLNAAAAVGDDRIQQKTQGRIDPETFTHGTSAQRVKWFRTGFDTGQPSACDTFNQDI
ncbi:MAG: neutral zinc metallopeptidase [Actinomycetota bacterium]